jgi:hypothetical protein
MRSAWGNKSQARQISAIDNKLNQVVKVGRIATVPISDLSAQSDLKTRGAQLSFQVLSLEGIDSFVLMRNFSRDPGSAQQIHVWPVNSLKATPQTFPLNLQHTDADPAIAGQKSYYWLKAVPVSNKTGGNVFVSGPQLFDASNLPNAKQITGDYAAVQAYTPTTQPLSSATGVGVNQATIAVASFQIQYPFDANGDGVPDLVSYSSGSIGPLNDSTMYFIYFDDPTYAGGPQTYIASTQNPDVTAGLHRQYIGSITTPAHGGGGTFGGGGGGGACFSGNTSVHTERGRVPICEIKRGDKVYSRIGWRLVAKLLVHEFDGEMREMGSGELVTPGHRIWHENDWRPAGDLFPVKVNYKGRVYNLALKAKADRGQCYTLSNGLVAHNLRKL